MAIPPLSLQPTHSHAVRFQGEKKAKLSLEDIAEALETMKAQRGQDRKSFIEDTKKRDEIVWQLETNDELSALLKDILTRSFSENLSTEHRAVLADIVASKSPLEPKQANKIVKALDTLVEEGTGKHLADEHTDALIDHLSGRSLNIAQRDKLLQLFAKDELNQDEAKEAVGELTKDRDKAMDDYFATRLNMASRLRYKTKFVQHNVQRGVKTVFGWLGQAIDKLLPEDEDKPAKKTGATGKSRLEELDDADEAPPAKADGPKGKKGADDDE